MVLYLSLNYIDSFKFVVKAFMDQYKHNIKEYSIVTELCSLCQGPNETMDKYIPQFKKVWNVFFSIIFRLLKKNLKNSLGCTQFIVKTLGPIRLSF